jgi:hypothetical protein
VGPRVTTTRWCTRTDAVLHARASATTRTRWAVLTRCVGALSTFYPDAKDIERSPQRRAHGGDPADRQDADARGLGLPPHDRPAVRLPATTTSATPATSSHDVRCRARSTSPTTCWSARSTASSSCTPTTSRTARPRPCAAVGSSGTSTRTRHRRRRRLPVGPAHGGANEAVLKMLDEIGATAASRRSRVHQGKDKRATSG